MVNKLNKSKRDTFYAAIGRFVLTWAEVEMYLDLLVLELRDSNDDLPHQPFNKAEIGSQSVSIRDGAS